MPKTPPENATDTAHSPAPDAQSHVARLRKTVGEAFRTLAGDLNAPYALIDFPHHPNIGDNGIWLGEVDGLRALYGRPPVQVMDSYFEPSDVGRFVPPGGTIFLHGGGNFGDIWSGFQLYRERVVAMYPDHRIVQLPQTVHYDTEEAVARTRKAYAAHRDLHIMVRDRRSQDFVRDRLDREAMLVPDAAFHIDLERFGPGQRKRAILGILRTDKEQRADAAEAGQGFAGAAEVQLEDWRGFGPAYERRMRWITRRLRSLSGLPGAMALRRAHFDRMAIAYIRLGLLQLAEAEVIVTDRLHGHILSTLAGRPHVFIDNYYGKIAHFCEAWGMAPNVRKAANYGDAADLAQSLLAEVRAAG